MRIQISSRKNAGSVLLVCLGGAVIIGIGLISILSMVQAENASVSRSQAWNQSLVMAEAGVEEGMTLINKYVATASPVISWSTTAAADGWTRSGNVYKLNRTFEGGYYDVSVTNLNNFTVTIKCTGSVLWTNGPVSTIQRAILVTPFVSSLFIGAIQAKRTVSLSGSAVIDSFNSADPNYSSNGQYNSAKRTARGDILAGLSNGVSTVAVSTASSSRVYGHVYTGPNNTVTTSGSSGIGNTNYSSSGIQTGWAVADANVTIPDAPALPVPTFLWTAMPAKVGGICVLNGGGPGHTNFFQMTSGFGNLGSHDAIIITNGAVVLDVEYDFSMGSQSSIQVVTNSSLQAWFNGNPSIGGGGLMNGTGNATNLTLFGTTNCTSISYGGSSGFMGAIYAPYADITWSGSASIIGAAVGNSFDNSGGGDVHYDENLAGGASGAYVISTWREVPP